MVKIYLRIHHVICMQSFIGKGYSENFVQNFSNILNYIKSNPLLKCIYFVNCCDDICKCCPNKLYQNIHNNEQYVKYLDDSYESSSNKCKNKKYIKYLNNSYKASSNQCKDEQYVKYLDNEYKFVCKFKYNTKYSLYEINNIIKNNLTMNTFEKICYKCRWFEICKKLIKIK